MGLCAKCGGLVAIQGLTAGYAGRYCECVKSRDPARPMTFAEIQELFNLSMSSECEDAVRLLELVGSIERFHGIGR